jgi:hypothetical protein
MGAVSVTPRLIVARCSPPPAAARAGTRAEYLARQVQKYPRTEKSLLRREAEEVKCRARPLLPW